MNRRNFLTSVVGGGVLAALPLKSILAAEPITDVGHDIVYPELGQERVLTVKINPNAYGYVSRIFNDDPKFEHYLISIQRREGYWHHAMLEEGSKLSYVEKLDYFDQVVHTVYNVPAVSSIRHI